MLVCLASYTLLLALAVCFLSCSQQLHQIIVLCWNGEAYIFKSQFMAVSNNLLMQYHFVDSNFLIKFHYF